MKKIILGSVTLLSLFLAGCSNQGSETNQTDQSIEKKATTTTESPQSDSNSEKLSTTDSSDKKIPELQNKTAYEVFEREFKRQVLATDKDTKITMNKKDIVIQISLALSDEQIAQAQPMVDGMYKIVTSGQEVLQEYDPEFKAPKLTVIDSIGKIIATEKDGKMELEK
ncbi:hypothetical protein DW666_06635 [Streptococcus parasanguinis]|uniref:hypothetical protein n=1 Tax=Streptococcus parasanguinis TaxID=1318 RepID=UPI000E515A49|nr:hypothetical protein [Streptococcus parasanguinis]RHF68693.1 hypothetical protein DW666_06635 [Streptococcus parasanguinis]